MVTHSSCSFASTCRRTNSSEDLSSSLIRAKTAHRMLSFRDVADGGATTPALACLPIWCRLPGCCAAALSALLFCRSPTPTAAAAAAAGGPPGETEGNTASLKLRCSLSSFCTFVGRGEGEGDDVGTRPPSRSRTPPALLPLLSTAAASAPSVRSGVCRCTAPPPAPLGRPPPPPAACDDPTTSGRSDGGVKVRNALSRANAAASSRSSADTSAAHGHTQCARVCVCVCRAFAVEFGESG